MGSVLVIALILAALVLWLAWAVGRIRRRRQAGKGCGSCSADCPCHGQCR